MGLSNAGEEQYSTYILYMEQMSRWKQDTMKNKSYVNNRKLKGSTVAISKNEWKERG